MADQAAHLSSALHTGRVPIPRFKSGEISPNAWNRAEQQLKAAFISQGCPGAWSSTPCVTDPDNEDSDVNKLDDNKEKIAQHNSALALLTASFSQNKQLTAIINRSITVGWQNGRTWDIFDRLQKKFKRFNKAGRQQRMAQMEAIQMGKNDNPQDMFDEVHDIIRLDDQANPDGVPTSNERIRDIIESKLPREYLIAIEHAESKDQREQLANYTPQVRPPPDDAAAGAAHTVPAITYEPMSIDVLEEAVMDHYYFLNKNRPFEATLAAVAPQRNYHSANKPHAAPHQYITHHAAKHCYYCHKDGHTEAECRKKKNDRSNKKCTHCGSNTHTVDRCFQLHPHLRMQGGNKHMNGRRGNRPNNNSFNSRRGNNNNLPAGYRGPYRQGQPRGGPRAVPRRAGGGGYEYNVANIDNRAEFVLASVEATQRAPKKVTFADRIAKSHEDRITQHLKAGAEQTITVARQHDAFDQLFNDVSDSDSFIDMSDDGSEEQSYNTEMVSDGSLNGLDAISLTTNMSGTSSLFNEVTLYNSESTSTHPLNNELRDTSSSKADESTLDASVPAELDGPFDQSNNSLFEGQDGQTTDTLLNNWREHQRVGPRVHNPNMFCEDCRVYGHTRDRCARNQAMDGVNQWHARLNESDEPGNENNGQDQESESQESENIFPIDIDQDDATDTGSLPGLVDRDAYDGDDDVYDGEYTVTSGSTQDTEASTSHNWEQQDESSVIQVRNELDNNIDVGPLPDEVVITHEEALPTFNRAHSDYAQQITSVSQTAERPLIDTGATQNVTQVVTPERQRNAPAPEVRTQLAIRQGWTTASPDAADEPSTVARQVSLPVTLQVAEEVMTPGPHLGNADELQRMIDEQRSRNYRVYRANVESLNRGQAFIRTLELEGQLDTVPRAQQELVLTNMDFVRPNDAERILGHALHLCPNECRQVWFKLRQLSPSNRWEGATLRNLTPEENRHRVCYRHCRQMWQQMANLAEQNGTFFPPMRNGVPDFRDGQHPDE